MNALLDQPRMATDHASAAMPLTCRVERNWSALEPMQREWDDFVEKAKGEVYFSFDWCRIWWKHYGRGELHVQLFHEGDTLVGLLPLMIERIWVGPIRVRIARFIGSHSTIAVLHPPAQDRSAGEVFRQSITRLLEDERVDAICFSSLSGEFTTADQIRQACQSLGDRVVIARDRVTAPHTLFHLPETFDLYLASLSGNERGNFRRVDRRLAELGPIRLDSHRDPKTIDDAFDRFAELHREHWRDEGKLGHFGDWPKSMEFTRDLLHAFASKDRASIEVLTVNEQPCVMELAFEFGDTSYWRLPARRVDAELEKRGVGRISLIRFMGRCIERGIRRIEGGPGAYEYKTRLGAATYQISSLVITRPSMASRLKSKLLNAWAEAWHLGYYKIWFNRICKRIPALRGPLWKTWIRTRI